MENKFCSRAFLFLGVHPNKSLNKWLCMFNISLTIWLVFLAGLKYYHDKNPDIVETFSIFGTITIKYSMLVFGSKTVQKILEARDQFWKLNVTDDQTTFLWNHLKRVEDIYKPAVMFCLVMFIVKPFIIKGSSIFNTYIFPEIPLPIYLIVDSYVVAYAAFVFLSSNIFVCCLIISVAVQFRYLNMKVEALKFENVEDDRDLDTFMQDLRSIVQYQQFLMRYVKDLNRLISVPVALLMVSSTSHICINMYIVSTNETSITDNLRVIVTTFLLTFEFFMVYGLPAQLLMDESTATADMVYHECKWYLPNLRPLRNEFLFMVLGSQKGVCIRAGNYHVVNNRTILLMLKTAYSFYTFLQKVV